ncbi:MAG TPA: methyltransferase domain-containing protein [Sorangium sp.]|nr:methyltransferase domain-containing protein [Sorangium sp.]
MIVSVQLENVAGYETLRWESLGPRRNLLYGVNGAGKSTVLDAIAYALSVLAGDRRGGPFPATYRGGRVTLGLRSPVENIGSFAATIDVDFSKRVQGAVPEAGLVPRPLIVQEDRQPQPRIGKANGRIGNIRDPNSRYRALVGLLRTMLPDERNSIFERACDILGDRALSSAGWIAQELLRNHVRSARPLSCGQYDVLALLVAVADAAREHRRDTGGVALIDSPETFTHPAALGKLIQAVEDMLPYSQILVATHAPSLLTSSAPGESFWLARTGSPAEEVRDMRSMPSAEHQAFSALYGADVAETLARIASKGTVFLQQCADAANIPMRMAPSVDAQFGRAEALLRGCYDLLEVGAGTGDFLKFAIENGLSLRRYVGTNESSNSQLNVAIAIAAKNGISASEYIADASTRSRPRARFDGTVALNVLHEVPFEHLPNLLLCMLEALRPGGMIVCGEQNVLPVGEREFIFWRPSEMAMALRPVAKLDLVPAPRAFFAARLLDHYSRMDGDEQRVGEAFKHLLPEKRRQLAQDIAAIYSRQNCHPGGRDLAFLLAQLAHVVLLEERLGHPAAQHGAAAVDRPDRS